MKGGAKKYFSPPIFIQPPFLISLPHYSFHISIVDLMLPFSS